ncbi:MAG: hypothetical protein FD180_4353 [Planctomycetota bacterium]|nr:MAG: hypothetical protein FD180_4353 [Planctomycetota bacterium]
MTEPSHDFQEVEANELLGKGWHPNNVVEHLVKQGVREDSARTLVAIVAKTRLDAGLKCTGIVAPGVNKMKLGGLLCVGGTIASVAGAYSAEPGKTYTVWTGAIVVGAIYLIAGVSEWFSARK